MKEQEKQSVHSNFLITEAAHFLSVPQGSDAYHRLEEIAQMQYPDGYTGKLDCFELLGATERLMRAVPE